jgi:hypothetical protein
MRVMNAKRWSARMGVTALVTVAGCAVVLGIMGPHPVQAQTPTEPPQVLSARYLLPPDLLAGPRFRVDDRVPTDGYMGHYTLRSEVGTFTVVSRDLLKIRIAELAVIEQLEATSKTDVFLSGAARAAERPVQAVVNIVTNPVGTVESLPGGISRFFDRVEMGGKAIEQAAMDASKSSDQRAQETAQRVGDVTITALGYEQVHRQLAKSLGVDPYTTNPVLAKKITDVAWVAFSARLGVDLLMSAAVPGSTFISLTSITSDLVYDTPKADLIVALQQKLMRMGASEAVAGALIKNRRYSLTVLTTLVTELERLGGVKGRPDIIALATTAANEEEARFLAASVQVLARLNVTGMPLKAMIARRTAVGVTPGGALVLPAPVDYLSWTEQIARIAAQRDLHAPRRGLWLSGRMSPRAQYGLSELGWAIHEAPTLTGAR